VEETLAVVDALSLPDGEGEGVAAAVPVPVEVGDTVGAAVFVVVPDEDGVDESEDVTDALAPRDNAEVGDWERDEESEPEDDGVIDGVGVPDVV
jgi:hypothetical protein